MYIERDLETRLSEAFHGRKVVVLYGSRQTGKTTIVEHLLEAADIRIEKWEQDKVWSAVLWDADNQGYPYVKRFLMEATKRKQNFLGENQLSKLILLTDQVYPRLQVVYGGNDEFRGSEEIDVEQFITVKGFKAKGKRLTTYQTESITELEPTRFPEPPEEPEETEDTEPPLPHDLTAQQTSLFTDEDF